MNACGTYRSFGIDQSPATAGRFDAVERAMRDLEAGRAVVLADTDGQNEGDLIFAAAKATPSLVTFMIRHTSGCISVALTGAQCDLLELPPMCPGGGDEPGGYATVTVDARLGITTGISAKDRAHTFALLADDQTSPTDMVRPGHVLPLRTVDDGVLRHPGRAEAAVDLARLAGLAPAAVLCEIVSPADGTKMARGDELPDFADQHGLTCVTIADLVAYRRRFEKHLERVTESAIPTPRGTFNAHGYVDSIDQAEYLVMVAGDVHDGVDIPALVHVECLTGDIFGSLRCGCSARLDSAMEAIAEDGRGVVIYVRRDPGLRALHAFQPRAGGICALEGSARFAGDFTERVNNASAQILADLSISSARLLNDDPATCAGLESYGVHVVNRGTFVPVAQLERAAG